MQCLKLLRFMTDSLCHTPCYVFVQSPDRRKILNDEWERKLAGIRVRKEDMNRLVMNFLVTEASPVSPCCWSYFNVNRICFLCALRLSCPLQLCY